MPWQSTTLMSHDKTSNFMQYVRTVGKMYVLPSSTDDGRTNGGRRLAHKIGKDRSTNRKYWIALRSNYGPTRETQSTEVTESSKQPAINNTDRNRTTLSGNRSPSQCDQIATVTWTNKQFVSNRQCVSSFFHKTSALRRRAATHFGGVSRLRRVVAFGCGRCRPANVFCRFAVQHGVFADDNLDDIGARNVEHGVKQYSFLSTHKIDN